MSIKLARSPEVRLRDRSITLTTTHLRRRLGGGILSLTAAIAVGAVMTATASATIGPLTPVTTFNAMLGQTPENLAVGPDGTVYVSLANASEIVRIPPSGPATYLPIPSGGGITVGIALVPGGQAVDVAVRSADASDAGIWQVPLSTFADPQRIAGLPTAAFPNGITFDRRGNLYIADSSLGVIWRLPPRSSTPEVWSSDALLAPAGGSFDGFPLPGANGIKVFRGMVYVSNTSSSEMLRVPIQPNGAAGTVTVWLTGVSVDDFAFALSGDIYAASNPASQLLMITPTGATTVVASGPDGLANTSATLFDPAPGHRTTLYVTNSAYFGGTPSLQEINVGEVGYPLP
jgi:streptogramin lyase